jgi:hypothetical protein
MAGSVAAVGIFTFRIAGNRKPPYDPLVAVEGSPSAVLVNPPPPTDERMDVRHGERKAGPNVRKMVQHRCWPDNNRRGLRRRLHDHRRGGGAHWRGVKRIGAIRRFADRHARQPIAGPGGSPGFSERPDRKPDRAGTAAAVASRPAAGDVERSDLHLHPHLRTELSGAGHRAELSGASHRVELGRAVDHLDHLYADAWRCGCYFDADAGIATQPGLCRDNVDIGGTATVDGTERGPTDPRLDPRRGATVRVTGLGEALDTAPRSRPTSWPTNIHSEETFRGD